jgi:hypothetical protein
MSDVDDEGFALNFDGGDVQDLDYGSPYNGAERYSHKGSAVLSQVQENG